MDFFMVVTVVVALISAGSAIPTKVQKWMNLLENRINTLETHTSLRRSPDTIENALTETQHNMTEETDKNIQNVINYYNDLKLKVQNINLTLIDLQEEIQQYITSDRETTSLLSAKLKELVSRLGLIEKAHITMGENYNEMKQDFKRMVISSDAKSKPIKACPGGWNRYRNFCYKHFNKHNRNYSEAERKCTNKGAYVIDIQDGDENTFLDQFTYGDEYNWIGLTTDSNLKWARTNSTPTYTNWQFGEAGRNLGCATHYGKWMILPCSRRHSFVCKKSCKKCRN